MQEASERPHKSVDTPSCILPETLQYLPLSPEKRLEYFAKPSKLWSALPALKKPLSTPSPGWAPRKAISRNGDRVSVSEADIRPVQIEVGVWEFEDHLQGICDDIEDDMKKFVREGENAIGKEGSFTGCPSEADYSSPSDATSSPPSDGCGFNWADDVIDAAANGEVSSTRRVANK